jgi:beta-lactam-binding protein with PASTA domain
MYLNRRPNQSSSRRMAAWSAALLIGALVAPFAVQAQNPPFATPLPQCYVPPSPGTDGWPVAVADDLGSTPAAAVTFSRATLASNDIGTSLVVTSVDAVTSNGGHITGTDPVTYTPPIPFLGTDTFSYEITDAAGQTAIGVVSITSGFDTIPPNISITAPTGGAVSGSVLVTASASDNVGVTSVSFFDADSQIGPTLVAAPFQTVWNTTLVGDGTHALSAIAFDVAGNVASTAPVFVTVDNANATTVPNVVGLTQAAAQTAITGASLVVGTVTTSNSATVAAGLVISQTPAGGSGSTRGSAVALSVSLGPALVTVPTVTGLTQAAAQSAITGATLTVGAVTTANSGTVAAGLVISQSPSGGSSAAPNSAVGFVVSLGPALVTVPTVTGLTQAAAQSAITGATLVVGTVTTANSSTVASGLVISQSPTAGSSALPGSSVAFVVSTGPVVVTGVPTVDKMVFSEGAGKRTTAAFSTAAAGETLVAFAASDGPTAANGQTLTIAGAGLTWTRVRRAATQFGDAEIWTASAPSVLTNVTVSSTQSAAGVHQSLTVIAFSGVAGVGASNVGGAATGAPSTSLVTTAAGSVVYGVGNDWDRAVARTIPSGQTKVHEFVDSAVGDTFWVQSANGTTASAGSTVTLNATAPTGDKWNMAIVELTAGTAPAAVSVPNVVGMTQTAAQTAITGAGLTLGAISNVSSATVPAGQVVSETPAAGVSVAAGTTVALVVSSGPAVAGPAVDATVFSDGAGARTTAPFSTTGATVLIALAASDGPTTGTNNQFLTVSGAGLTWTRVVRAAASRGVSEIWTASAPAALSSVTVTSSQSIATVLGAPVNQSLTVVAFTGASGVGASSIASGLSGGPSASLGTTADASVVYGVGIDFDQAVARTVPAGQTKVHEFLAPSGDTMWMQKATATVAIAGTSVTLNDTAPTGDQWNFAIVEVKR